MPKKRAIIRALRRHQQIQATHHLISVAVGHECVIKHVYFGSRLCESGASARSCEGGYILARSGVARDAPTGNNLQDTTQNKFILR